MCRINIGSSLCRINIGSSLCAPDEWGELVPSKIFNPSFLTLMVGHLVVLLSTMCFIEFWFAYQCVVALF